MKVKRKYNRLASRPNGGAMADIGFLLLVFFMVCTVIFNDRGIVTKLPEWQPEAVSVDVPGKSINIFINETNEVLIGGVSLSAQDVKPFVLKILDSYTKKGVRQILELQSHRGTRYGAYLKVYDQLIRGIMEFRSLRSNEMFGKDIEQLSHDEYKRLIRSWPVVISESEVDL